MKYELDFNYYYNSFIYEYDGFYFWKLYGFSNWSIFQKMQELLVGVVGVLQFGLGAIISSIALSFHSETFLPIALSISIISFLAFLIMRTYKI
jgi:hypothetical protein